jgi:hypothetical protein
MSYIHDKYVVIAADKTSNNIGVMSKLHWIYCLIKEEGILNSLDNPLYTSTTFTKAEILCNHISVLFSFGILTKNDELDYQSLYWSP